MPAGGSRQSAPAESHANVLEARSGILPCAEAGLANATMPDAAITLVDRSVLSTLVNGDIAPSISSGIAVHASSRKRSGSVVVRQVPRSEIGLLGARHRKQIVSEVILIVLGADGFQQRVFHLPPALHQVQRLAERVGVGDLHQYLKRLPVGRRLEPFHDLQL